MWRCRFRLARRVDERQPTSAGQVFGVRRGSGKRRDQDVPCAVGTREQLSQVGEHGSSPLELLT